MYGSEENQSLGGSFSEELGEIEPYKWSLIGIDYLLLAFHHSIRKVDPFIGQVIDSRLQIATFHSRHDVGDCILNCYIAIVLIEQLIEAEIVRGAQPVHCVVNYIIYSRMPSIVLG